MKTNYHTHTYRCKHAVGSEEDYVKKAIKEGIEILGFSDHAPFDFKNGYVSRCRMELGEIDGYFETVLNLKEKYADYIKILVGFEIEYYDDLWEEAINTYKKYPLDYLLLGQHFVRNESYEKSDVFDPIEDVSVLKQYVDGCINAINTDRITYVAHPDCINFVGDKNVFQGEMSRLLAHAKQKNMPIEYNLLGVRSNRNYPNKDFWSIVSDFGCEVVIGCDAHQVCHVGDKNEFEDAMRFMEKYKLNYVEDVKLKNPIF